MTQVSEMKYPIDRVSHMEMIRDVVGLKTEGFVRERLHEVVSAPGEK